MWPPASPLPSDTALSYFLGELITTSLPLALAESASRHANSFPIQYYDVSDSGQKKLAGLGVTSLRTLANKALACASTANDGLVFVVCTKLANTVVDQMISPRPITLPATFNH